jgi:hypothetical protein
VLLLVNVLRLVCRRSLHRNVVLLMLSDAVQRVLHASLLGHHSISTSVVLHRLIYSHSCDVIVYRCVIQSLFKLCVFFLAIRLVLCIKVIIPALVLCLIILYLVVHRGLLFRRVVLVHLLWLFLSSDHRLNFMMYIFVDISHCSCLLFALQARVTMRDV